MKDAGYFADRKAPDLLQFLDLVALGLALYAVVMGPPATAGELRLYAAVGEHPGVRAWLERSKR